MRVVDAQGGGPLDVEVQALGFAERVEDVEADQDGSPCVSFGNPGASGVWYHAPDCTHAFVKSQGRKLQNAHVTLSGR